MTDATKFIHSDPEIMGGTVVFVGTRVPVKNLIDYLAGGHSLEDFIDDFPSVPPQHIAATLSRATELLVADAHTS